MKSEIIKEIKTSCQYPLLEYSASVNYNEVRKASGVAYILLVLIQKSVMKKEKIATVLKKFGIPSDLLHIFAKELSALAANEIVLTDVNVNFIDKMKYFDEMLTGDFSLSPRGKKMFMEGAIPTGNEKTKKTDLFYSPVTRKYGLSTTQSYAPLESSFLGKDFMSNVSYDVDDMEDYLKSVKSKIGLKAEEMIVSLEYEKPILLSAKTDGNFIIDIDAEGVTFQFPSSDEKAFFEKYYTSALMSKGMLAKEKYKFDQPVETLDWCSFHADNLYIPADLQKQAEKPCVVFLNRGILGYRKSGDALKFENCGKLLDILNPYADFALLDLTGCKYFIPANIRFPNKVYGDVFEMQALVETKADNRSFEDLLHQILSIFFNQPFSEEAGQIVAYISQVMNDPTYMNDYAERKLEEIPNLEDRINLLLQMHSTFEKQEGWISSFRKYGSELVDSYVKTVEVENVIFQNAVLLPLIRALNMSDADYIQRFSSHMKETEDVELVYQALESAEFEERLILSVANVIPIYLDQILDRERFEASASFANQFSVMNFNFWKICDMLGVETLTDFTLRDDYQIVDFMNSYTTFKTTLNNIEKYRAYAEEEFSELDRYDDLFGKIHEFHAIEQTASQHPDKITGIFIDTQIAKGNYSAVISNLLIKAQYDLRKLLSETLEAGALELIDEAKQKRLITEKQAALLHHLRMCRNALQHPEKKQIPFDKENLKQWRDIVFSLKGVQK